MTETMKTIYSVLRRRGPATDEQIAARTRLHPSTARRARKTLQDEQHVQEMGTVDSAAGQPMRVWNAISREVA